MAKRMTDKALIWRALNEAWENVDGLIDAHGHMSDSPVVADGKAFLARIDDYAMRKFGRSVSAGRRELERTAGTPVDVILAQKLAPSEFKP
jgi:hypothetical protein